MTTQTEIAISKLRISDNNARTTPAEKQADKQLKASIAAHGVIQNLVVKPALDDTGMFNVCAGGRRYRLVTELIEAGKLDTSIKLPCVVLDAHANDLEISLAENFARAGMHPIDQLEAFHKLSKDNGGLLGVKDLAAHFGKSQADVKKILALGNCAPELLDECRQGKLDVDTLRAFTVEPDKTKQVQAYQALTAQGSYMLREHSVRALLTDDLVPDTDHRARFVGLQDYMAAGGGTQKDLFKSVTYLTDKVLLQELANKKLHARAAEFEAAGWSFAEIDIDHEPCDITQGRKKLQGELTEEGLQIEKELEEKRGRVENLQEIDAGDDDAYNQKLGEQEDELMEEISALEDRRAGCYEFTDEQRQQSGVVLTIGADGSLVPVKGITTDTPAEDAKASKAKSDTGGSETEKQKYSNSLVTDLHNYKTEIARRALIDEPDLAVEILHFQLIVDMFHNLGTWFWGSPMDMQLRNAENESSQKDMPAQPARKERRQKLEHLRRDKEVKKLEKALGDRELVPAFEAFLRLKDYTKQGLLAHAAAYALKQESTHNTFPGHILAITGTYMADYWRPTADNFFKRISKPTVLEVGRQIMGETWVGNNAALPKKDLAIRLEDECELGKPGQHFIPEPMLNAVTGDGSGEALPPIEGSDVYIGIEEQKHAASA